VDLKDMLKDKGLIQTGRKVELVERLLRPKASDYEGSEKEPATREDLADMKVTQLKRKCKSAGLIQSGKKEDLVERLLNPQEADVAKKKPPKKQKLLLKHEKEKVDEVLEYDDLKDMRVVDLHVKLKARKLSTTGAKKDLIERLLDPSKDPGKKKKPGRKRKRQETSSSSSESGSSSDSDDKPPPKKRR